MTRARILVVDDDPSICGMLQAGLGKAGYELLIARDGEEASRLWRETGADLVIADIYMPHRSGLQLIMEVKDQSPTTPIIAISDGGRTENLNPLRYAEVLGRVRTLAKPFALDALLALVRQELPPK
jgi:two-component system, chemotaxis family, chemotaxis protein CheY